MTVAILSLGTELTRGELENQNATWLAERLTDLGLEVTEILTTDDDDRNIQGALARLAQAHDAIVSTGGLGPTSDDRTTACVAELLGVPLVTDEVSLQHIRGLFAARGVPFSLSNEKQARFPRGATILPNSLGTAPGFSIHVGASGAFFLPGVPSEMRRMFELEVAPRLPQPAGYIAFRRLVTYGMAESKVGELLQGLEEQHQVTLGYRASLGQVEVKVQCRVGHSRVASDRVEPNPVERSEGVAEAEARAERALADVAERLGSCVFTRERETLAQHLGRLLGERGQTLGLAESCTGGLVSQLITRHAGASDYYRGGICAYANDIKLRVVGVDPTTLDAYGAVSAEVAREMAVGARRVLGVDFALALTGVAGPDGGSSEKPVGLVHWAVAGPGGVHSEQRVFPGDRNQVQKRAAFAGLWSVRRMLLDPGDKPAVV